jgi:hypothetical protein
MSPEKAPVGIGGTKMPSIIACRFYQSARRFYQSARRFYQSARRFYQSAFKYDLNYVFYR